MQTYPVQNFEKLILHLEFGFFSSLNVGSTEYTNLMYNYEVAPSDSQPQSLLDILTIDMKMSTHQHQDQSRRVVKNTYFHVNQ